MENNRQLFRNLFGYITQLYNDVMHGISPLHRAFLNKRGFLHIKSQIDENPRFINFRDRSGYTPLHLVFNYDVIYWYKFFGALLEAGADVNAKTNNGETPLSLLCDDPTYPLMLPVLRDMLKDANKETIDSGLCQVVQNFFHESGCLENNKETDCKNRHTNVLESVKILLNHGADFDVQYLKEILVKMGEISLNTDCLKKFKSMCRVLIKYTVIKSVFKESYIENTLIMENVTSSDDDRLKILLELHTFIANYITSCVKELFRLQHLYIEFHYTVYDFMQEYFLDDHSVINCHAKLAKLLFLFRQSKCVRYRKFFYESVKCRHTDDLLIVESKLRGMQVGKVAKNSLRGINADCFQEIAKYLSKDELIDVMTGIYGVFT